MQAPAPGAKPAPGGAAAPGKDGKDGKPPQQAQQEALVSSKEPFKEPNVPRKM